MLLTLVAAAAAHAQADLPSDAEVDRWMQGPEQHLPGWSVHVQPAVLTFELRFAVAIKAYASVHKAKLALHDLHVFVRVNDEASQYVEKHHGAIRKIPGTADVAVAETFYAKPGDYLVAFAVYDAINKTHGVWKKSVHVAGSHCLLPDYPQATPVEFIDPDAPFAPTSLPSLPAVGNPQPLQVDIVLNLTERKELELEPNWSLEASQQNFATQSILSIARTLAALPVNGCVRLSAIEATRAKVYLDRASTLDTAALLKTMQTSRNVNQVDLHTLALRKTASTFIKDFIDRTVKQSPACDTVVAGERVILLVSDSLMFPEHSSLDPVDWPPGVQVRTYLFRLTVPDMGELYDYLGVSRRMRLLRLSRYPDDQVGTLLKPLDPHVFKITQPKDFQKALTTLMDDLKKK